MQNDFKCYLYIVFISESPVVFWDAVVKLFLFSFLLWIGCTILNKIYSAFAKQSKLQQQEGTKEILKWSSYNLIILKYLYINAIYLLPQLTLILLKPKVVSLCHQYISVLSDQTLYCWPTNFKSKIILITLKMIMVN